jgi:hypothetical protein
MEEFRQSVKNGVMLLKPDYDEDLVEFVTDEVIDRALVYCNREDLPSTLIKPFVSTVIRSYETFGKVDQNGIRSVKDGEQTVTYEGVQSYMVGVTDTELFLGMSTLLKNLRKATSDFEEDENTE